MTCLWRPPRRLLTLALVLLTCLSAPSAAQERGTPRHDAWLSELDTLLRKGDSAGASTLLAKLESEAATSERFAFDVIYVLVSRGRIAEARALWNQLGARLQESLSTDSGARHEAAAEARLKRRYAEASFVQGLLIARDGAKREALDLLRKADGLGFPPLDSPLMLLAAECLLDLGEHGMAAQAYGEILRHAPRNATARLGLGVALFSSGDLATSETELARVLREAPQTPHIRLWLGAVLLERKRTAEAEAHLEKEWAMDSRCVGCAAKLAHIAYLGGDDEKCRVWIAKALALSSSHAEANLVAGMLANRSGDFALAIRHLTGVVTQAPDSVRARYQLAVAYRRSGDTVKAREHMDAYDRLIAAQKADSLGVRGSSER